MYLKAKRLYRHLGGIICSCSIALPWTVSTPEKCLYLVGINIASNLYSLRNGDRSSRIQQGHGTADTGSNNKIFLASEFFTTNLFEVAKIVRALRRLRFLPRDMT